MKRFTLLTIFALFAIGSFAQGTYINFGAYVYDQFNNPVANQAITVIDSSSSTPANITVTSYITNSFGYFMDSAFLGGSGNLYMFLVDSCNVLHMADTSYTPNIQYVSWQNTFVVCGGTPSGGNCNFSVTAQTSALGAVFSSSYNGNPTSVYTWSFGDGTSAVGQTVTHAYAQPGTYVYCLAVDSCVVCDTVTISGSPVNCNAASSVSSIGLYTWVGLASLGSPGMFTINWGDGTVFTTPSINLPFVPYNHTYATAGTYNVCVEHYDSTNCYDQVCHPITVTPSPLQCNASFVIDTINSQPGTVYLWNMTTVTGASPNAQVYFTWDFGDGSNSSSSQYPTHAYQNPGTYTVCVQVVAYDSTSLGGVSCASSFCDTLTVDQNGNIIYKGAILGWNLVVLNPATMSIDEGALEDATVYPNPAHNVLRIALPEAVGTAEAQVYSVNGSLVNVQQLQSGENTLDVANLPAGMYVIQLKWETATAEIKFIKN